MCDDTRALTRGPGARAQAASPQQGDHFYKSMLPFRRQVELGVLGLSMALRAFQQTPSCDVMWLTFLGLDSCTTLLPLIMIPGPGGIGQFCLLGQAGLENHSVFLPQTIRLQRGKEYARQQKGIESGRSEHGPATASRWKAVAWGYLPAERLAGGAELRGSSAGI